MTHAEGTPPHLNNTNAPDTCGQWFWLLHFIIPQVSFSQVKARPFLRFLNSMYLQCTQNAYVMDVYGQFLKIKMDYGKTFQAGNKHLQVILCLLSGASGPHPLSCQLHRKRILVKPPLSFPDRFHHPGIHSQSLLFLHFTRKESCHHLAFGDYF